MSKADGAYIREINRIEKQDLLIMDDFGLQEMDSQNRMTFLEIIEDRYDRKSTIISSQLPVNKWYEVIGDSTIADYPHFFIMPSNPMVYAVNHLFRYAVSTKYFA
jgi:DNA replication protein DnaC